MSFGLLQRRTRCIDWPSERTDDGLNFLSGMNLRTEGTRIRENSKRLKMVDMESLRGSIECCIMSRWYFSVALDLMCRSLNFEVDLDPGCGC